MNRNRRLLHSEALLSLRSETSRKAGVERLALSQAAGRYVAESVESGLDVPGHDNSAVDGYAFAHGSTRLEVVSRIAAGDGIIGAVGAESDRLRPIRAEAGGGGDTRLRSRLRGRSQRGDAGERTARAAGDTTASVAGARKALPPGCAARIFTGAVIPEGADTVAMQEDCALDEEGFVSVPSSLERGANLRLAGEDVRKGRILVEAGSLLRPQELAGLASAGKREVPVFSRLRVGVLSCGDEIRRPGEPLPDGGVHDSNHFLLFGLLRGLPVEAVDLGVQRDSEKEIRESLIRAAGECDAIITSGGVSQGEEDHVGRALEIVGERFFHQLAIKPGRPMCFGRIGKTPIFSLPGNPVAVFVCFLLYARPSLIQLGGGKWSEPQRYRVRTGFSFPRKKPGRREFWRAWIEDGIAFKFERDGSGLISGLRKATGLIEIPEEVISVEKGEEALFLPFAEAGIPPAG